MPFGPLDPNQALSTIFGSKQLGAAAPQFLAGLSNFQPQGLLDDQALQANQLINPQNFTAQSLEELIGRPEQRGQELAPQVTANDQSSIVGPPEAAPVQGPPEDRAGSDGFLGGLGQRAEGFFGNLDQNLQSPSKVIGLGLLNRIDPRLAGVGLLAGGLLGKNRVF